MRSRLPGKLRSSALLLYGMFVKDRAGFAERRFVKWAFVGQTLHQTDQAPGQQQAKAQQQQHGDRNTHFIHRGKTHCAIVKRGVFQDCRNNADKNVSEQKGVALLQESKAGSTRP